MFSCLVDAQCPMWSVPDVGIDWWLELLLLVLVGGGGMREEKEEEEEEDRGVDCG